MSDLILSTAGLPELSVRQILALPPQQLQELDIALKELSTWVKQSRERIDAALESRYGEQGRAALLASGRDFGVAHFTDCPLRIRYELPKKVRWDQHQLTAIAERILSSGEKLEGYLDIKLSVSESRYANWPPTLQQPFAAARTVEAGKPSFRLAFDGEAA